MHSTTIQISNAGLILLNPYIPVLFDYCGLTCENKFIGVQSQQRAVVLLHYLVTGEMQAEDRNSALSKVLCGLPVNTSIDSFAVEISGTEKSKVEDLLKAFVANWPAIGDCSIQGVRSDWLVHDGMLLDEGVRWNLKMNKYTFDLLLNSLPYSLSCIRYNWMEKMIYVNRSI